MAQIVGTLGAVETLTVGGRTFVNVSALITLQAWCDSNTHAVMRKSGGTSGYAVTAGKVLTIEAMRVLNGSQTGNIAIAALAQVDTDIGMDSSSAFVNPVGMTTTSLSGPSFGVTVSSSIPGTSANDFGGLGFPVASTKFVGAYMQATSRCWAWGYEA